MADDLDLPSSTLWRLFPASSPISSVLARSCSRPTNMPVCESFSHDLARFRRSVQALVLVLDGFDLIFELFLGGRLFGLVQRVLS